MARHRRTERLNRLFQEELARLIRVELKDPRVQTATITAVETTSDLAHATVYVRTLGDRLDVGEAIEGLESASGYIRRELGQELRLRRIPELHFEVDRTLERAQRIEELLEMARESEAEADGSSDD